MKILSMRSNLRWIVAGGIVAALVGYRPAAAQSGPALHLAPIGQPVPLVSVGEHDGVNLLEETTGGPRALSQPYCSEDPGINRCLTARCNSGTCGLPALIDENHPYSLQIQVFESTLISFFGTANCTARDINVGLDVDHSYVSEVEASVSTVDGNVFLPIGSLLENNPVCPYDNLELVFDDSAGTAAPACQAADPAYQGTVRPHDNTVYANVNIPVGSSTDFNSDPTPYRYWAVDVADVGLGDSGQVRDVWIAWGLQCQAGFETCSISVNPSSPTIYDLPNFIISGNWGNGCLPSYESGTIDSVNRIIRINAVSNPTCQNCTQVVTPFTIPISIQNPLSAGSWQIQFHVSTCSGAYQQHCSHNFQVTQPSCSFSINPTSATSPAAGSSGSVAVTATSGCGWTAFSNAGWISITSGSSGSGNGSVSYTVAQNGTTSPRTGTITIAGQTFTVNQNPATGSSCTAGNNDLCLGNSRFRVSVNWRNYTNQTGVGHPVPFTTDSGMFWFFSSDNIEFLVKVVNGCSLNSRHWVYAAATTDVEYTLTVTDTLRNVTKSYFNPLGTASPAITDSSAFATCP